MKPRRDIEAEIRLLYAVLMFVAILGTLAAVAYTYIVTRDTNPHRKLLDTSVNLYQDSATYQPETLRWLNTRNCNAPPPPL